VAWPRITGCYFDGWVFSAIYGDTTVIEGSNGHISNNWFFGATGNPANQEACIHTKSGYVVIHDNEILGGYDGIRVEVADFPMGYVRIINNTIEEQTVHGIRIFSVANQVANLVLIDNNEFSCIDEGDTYIASVYIEDNAGTNFLKDVHVTNNQTRHNLSGTNQKHFWIGNGQNVIVANNVLEELGAGATLTGIQMTGFASSAGLVAPILVSDNRFLGTYASGRYNVTTATQLDDTQGMTFAQMSAITPANGSKIYVTDGSRAASVLAGASTGALAAYMNGVWTVINIDAVDKGSVQTVTGTKTFTDIAATRYFIGTIFWSAGNGTPEGVVTAPVGSLFSRLDGGAITTLYVKTSGVGNTGWTAK
jgi:hypothetical protein